jgi:hypothetical protein
MAVGVAVANAILLVTFAENARQTGIGAAAGARTGAEERLRPILMTSCAMIAGMIPMALGLGEGGEQSAPLGRAVIGGLAVATGATLLILPAVFSVVMGGSKAAADWANLLPWGTLRFIVRLVVGPTRVGTASLHPDDADSPYYTPELAGEAGLLHGHAHVPTNQEGIQTTTRPDVHDLPPTSREGGGPPS